MTGNNPASIFVGNMLNKIKVYLYTRLRINRRPSNQLMFFWLKKALIKNKNLPIALDVGCVKSINRPYFYNKVYIGVDFKDEFIVKARQKYPHDTYKVADLSSEELPKGDIVVCTLVLNNKNYPVEKTIDGVRNLVDSVMPGGGLIFTLGHVNAQYKNEVEHLLVESFSEIQSYTYGRFNQPTYFSYILAMMMILCPKLRESRKNIMKFYSCSGRRLD